MSNEMKVPHNVREEFDTSDINVGMNAVEEANKNAVYVDDGIYERAQDERSVDVVKKIKDGVPYKKVYDDELKLGQLAQISTGSTGGSGNDEDDDDLINY